MADRKFWAGHDIGLRVMSAALRTDRGRVHEAEEQVRRMTRNRCRDYRDGVDCGIRRAKMLAGIKET